MTDWLSTGEGRADECKAVEAGVDLIMPGGKKTLAALKETYQTGKLPSNSIQRACKQVLSIVTK